MNDYRPSNMPIKCSAQTHVHTGCGRKRAFPTPSRRVWKVVSAVTLSASFVASLAFQQNLPLSRHHSTSSLTRPPTAVTVLADPTKLVKIETQQSVEDRAALEELYLLSSLAKKATRKKPPRTREATQKVMVASPIIDGEQTINSNGRTAKTIREEATQKRTKGIDSPSKKVCFKGLTTVPNPRNKKKKKPLVGSLSERLAIDQDEYIRNILQKKEDMLSYDPIEKSHSISNDGEGTAPLNANMSTNSYSKVKKHPNIVRNGRSSTMPGFEGTFREKIHADRIKVANQNSGIDFVETAESMKKQAGKSGRTLYSSRGSVRDSFFQFANEIHSVDRITPEEEVELGAKTQEALRLQHIYDGLVTKLEREPTDDEWCAASGKFNMEAIAQIIEEGLDAKNKLVTSNLRMVQGVVNVYLRNGLQENYNASDLMQEGIMALIRAAEKFDPSRGFRFSTYAMYWIRSAIKRDQCSQSRIIRVPQRLHETNKKILKNRSELMKTLDREPTHLELSEAIGMTVEQIERCETAFSQKMYSFDQRIQNRNNPTGDVGNRDTLYSICTSLTNDADYNEAELDHLREDLLQAMNDHLTEEEATILMLKFGMDDEYDSQKKIGRSFIEVGGMMGLTAESVRRSFKKSLKHLEAVVSDDFASYNRDFCI